MTMNEPTYKLFCPEIESPTRADFEQRARDEFGPGYFSPSAVTRTVMHILGDDEGVLNGQVHDLGMGRLATMAS